MRKTIIPALLLVWACALGALQAQENAGQDKAPEDKMQGTESIETIIGHYDAAQTEFRKLYGKAKTKEERSAILRDHYPDAEKYATRIMVAIEADPRGPKVFEGLQWIIQHIQSPASELKNKALDRLAGFAADPRMGGICTALRYSPSPRSLKLLEEVFEKNPDHACKGKALYVRGKLLLNMAGAARKPEEERKQAAQWYGKEYAAFIEKADPDTLQAEGEKLLEQVKAEFEDVPFGRSRTLAQAAKGDLFEARNLAIGKVAPDIVGEDIDGVPFKLSDYRGKVVMLDFWGHW